MDSNFPNVLENSQNFITAAALIVIVMLVWAQLYAREPKNLDKDFNLWCGVLWTYAAILFTLIAVAVLVLCGETSNVAKGFLTLSFLMTVTNILIAIGINIIKIIFGISSSQSLTDVRRDSRWRYLWGLGWFVAGVGLGFIAFSVAYTSPISNVLTCNYFRIGIGILSFFLVIALCKIIVLGIKMTYMSIRKRRRWKKFEKGIIDK